MFIYKSTPFLVNHHDTDRSSPAATGARSHCPRGHRQALVCAVDETASFIIAIRNPLGFCGIDLTFLTGSFADAVVGVFDLYPHIIRYAYLPVLLIIILADDALKSAGTSLALQRKPGLFLDDIAMDIMHRLHRRDYCLLHRCK